MPRCEAQHPEHRTAVCTRPEGHDGKHTDGSSPHPSWSD